MSIIQLRRDTTANWLSVNPVLAQGELGIAYNGDVVATIRIGNGASTWTQLPDFGGNGDLTQAAADLLYATLAQGELADSAVQPGDLPTFGDVVTHNASEFATAAQGTDARTPTAHAASHASAGTDPLTLAQSQVTGLTSDLAAKVGTSDPRLTDPRTPTSHAASHAAAGADPLTVAQSQVTNLGTDLAAKVPTSRTIAGLGLDADRSSADLKTALTLVKGDVGLGNVDNTADADKPVSTLQAAADSAAVAAAVQRSNHTGTQLLSTISDAGTAASRNVGTTSTTVAAGDAPAAAQAAAVAAASTDATTKANAAQAAAISAAASDATTKADAKVADTIADGTTTVAPSQNAVFDALALKITNPGGANDDFLQRKAGAWTNRTISQVKTDLGIPSVIPALGANEWKSPTISSVTYPIWPLGFYSHSTITYSWQNVIWYWFRLPVARTLTAFQIEVTTQSGTSGAVGVVGIHNLGVNLSGGTRVTSQTVGATTTGVKTITDGTALPAGEYIVWMRTPPGGWSLRYVLGYSVPDMAGSASSLNGHLGPSVSNFATDATPLPDNYSFPLANSGYSTSQPVGLVLS